MFLPAQTRWNRGDDSWGGRKGPVGENFGLQLSFVPAFRSRARRLQMVAGTDRLPVLTRAAYWDLRTRLMLHVIVQLPAPNAEIATRVSPIRSNAIYSMRGSLKHFPPILSPCHRVTYSSCYPCPYCPFSVSDSLPNSRTPHLPTPAPSIQAAPAH